MKQESSKGSKKRVTFLMPYIDFCFMLIIIFVGMLSIAYFEPQGKTDIQTKETEIIDYREGKFEIKPAGMQQSNSGQGEKNPENEIRPLIGQAGSVAINRGAARMNLNAAPNAAAQSGQAAGKPASYVNPEELEKLQKELEKQKAEIEKLKATQKEGTGGTQPPSSGQGDNYYIDLRPK
jgi:hypothetical protein